MQNETSLEAQHVIAEEKIRGQKISSLCVGFRADTRTLSSTGSKRDQKDPRTILTRSQSHVNDIPMFNMSSAERLRECNDR